MQGVSFPGINSSPTEQTVAAPCKNTPIRGLEEVPGAVDPRTATCLTPPRPVLELSLREGQRVRSSVGSAATGSLRGHRTSAEAFSRPMRPAGSLDSPLVTEHLRHLARWLEAQPWNHPGSDKTWVLRCADSFRRFRAQRAQARAVGR